MRPNSSCAAAPAPASAKTREAGDEVVGRVQQVRGQQRAEREEQTPPIDHEEMTPSEASRNGRRTDGGNARALRRQPRPCRCASTGSGMKQRADERDREQHEQDDVGQHARRGRELRRAPAETSTPRPMPPALTTPLVRPTPAGSRAGCRSSSAALAAPRARPVARPCSAAGDEQPRDRVGEHEQRPTSPSAWRARRAGPGGGRPRRTDGPASSSAASTPKAYDGVDQRQHDRREAPQLAVGAVERARACRTRTARAR